MIRKYKHFIGLMAALFIFAGVSTCSKAEELPETLHFQQQQFGLICGKPEDIRDELLKTHGEAPVVAGLLNNGTQYILYVSEDKNTMSFVIHKSDEEGCLVWSGASELGQAFMINPEPDFPIIAEDDQGNWNL
jgi:hypothetical protein